ncbi:MAG: SDR family NAD(P)-dependent oxidoreductase, partial [Solirubrobacteraceae bacterium]
MAEPGAPTTARATTAAALRPSGATVLVTGGSRGIGAAVSEALAADGWAVAVGYNTGRAEADAVVARIVDAGGSAIAVGGDVNDDPRGVLRAAGELGPVLGLVNNAGIARDDLALSMGATDWDDVLSTNLTAAFRLT